MYGFKSSECGGPDSSNGNGVLVEGIFTILCLERSDCGLPSFSCLEGLCAAYCSDDNCIDSKTVCVSSSENADGLKTCLVR